MIADNTTLHCLLALLVPTLESEGIRLGTDRYLRLQQLLAISGNNITLAQWRCRLAPVLATTSFEQERVHVVFDQCMDELRQLARQEERETQPELNRPDEKPSIDSTDLPSMEPKEEQIEKPQVSEKFPLVAELERSTKPPFSWNFQVGNDVVVELDVDLTNALPRLRHREQAEGAHLDMKATIQATVAQGGMPVFRYHLPTRPIEYLLLIDHYSLHDHRARAFDELYRVLSAEEVLVERFFYDSDLRSCRNENWPLGISLEELHFRHGSARLVVIGTGYRLIDPSTGRLVPWARVLQGWPKRMLLTPISRYEWGQWESELSEVFPLLPAALPSLQYLAENDDLEGFGSEYFSLPLAVRAAAEVEPIILQAPYILQLCEHFDRNMLAWIAACAVYPALHFGLTLRLGILASPSTNNLVTTSRLIALSRVPWFVQGHIPTDARRELVEYLEYRHPELRKRVLEELRSLLERANPPAPGSAARAEFEINLAMLRMAETTGAPSEALREEMRELVRRLDRPAEIWDFVLPASWERFMEDIGLEQRSGGQINVGGDENIKQQKDGLEDEGLPLSPDEGTELEEINDGPGKQVLRGFISYSSKDKRYCEELIKTLSPWVQKGELSLWSFDQLQGGEDAVEQIKRQMAISDIFFFLVSADFLASEFINDVELKEAFERSKRGASVIFPIIVRDCHWESIGWLSDIRVLPRNLRPVSRWESRDQCWNEISDDISRRFPKSSMEYHEYPPDWIQDIKKNPPVKVSIIYAYEDILVRDQLLKHLSTQIANGSINLWGDYEIKPGEDWEQKIADKFNQSELLLLLLSADFFNSEYILKKELPDALRRNETGECRLLSVIARECNWADHNRLSKIQVLPPKGRPIDSSEWPSKDRPYKLIVDGIKTAVREIQTGQYKARRLRQTGFTELNLKSAEELPSGKKYLFGIGINAYQSWQPLKNAVTDVQDVAKLLMERYDFDEANMKLLLDQQATRVNIVNGMYDLTRANNLAPEDSLLIYFSGHGQFDANEDAYWAPWDSKPNDIASWIPNSTIRDLIKNMKCRHVLLISDSCFSGALIQEGGRQWANVSTSEQPKSLGIPTSNSRTEDWIATELEQKKSRWILTSGGQHELDGNGRNSPFATALLSELKHNTAPKLIADDLFRNTRHNIYSHAIQQPEYAPLFAAGDMGGRFVFRLKGFQEIEKGLGNKSLDRTRREGPINPPLITPAPVFDYTDLRKKMLDKISSGKTEEVINMLKEYAMEQNDTNLISEISLIQTKWSKYNQDQRLGLISFSDASLEFNKLNIGIIEMIQGVGK